MPPASAPITQGADPLAPLLDLPGVAESFAAAREAVDRLLAHRVLRRRSSAVTAESALRAARASAALEGTEVSLAQLRDGSTASPVVQGALRVSAGLAGLVPVWERAPLQALARLHVLAAAGLVGKDRLGRPSGGGHVPTRLGALGQLVAGGGRTPGLLLAAVVHGELLALAPFGDADGVVARAAARLTLIVRGVDPKAVSIPEVGHLAQVEDYRRAVAAYSTGAPDGIASWLRHCGAATLLGAQEGLAICEAVQRG